MEKNFDENEAEQNKLFQVGKILEKQAFALSYELEWLSLRSQTARAELELNLARKSLNDLKLDFAKFNAFNRKLPEGKGFISTRDMVKWNARFSSREEDVQKAIAQRNLINREMKELRYRILEAGFSVPVGGVVE